MIRALADLSATQQAAAPGAIEEIFALTAATAGEAYFRRWTGHYLKHCRNDVLLAGKPPYAGYLTGCRDSAAAVALFNDLFYYRAFADLYPGYPAHFHINVRPAAQGRGIGRALVSAFLARCQTGVHVVTGATAPARGFYARLGFNEVHQRRVAGRDLVLYHRAYELTSDIQGKSDNDLSLPGSATSLFQAMQQASMMASVLSKSRSERNRSRK